MIAVLYVDDEPDLLTLAQLFLEQDGEFSVRTATSAREMLKSPDIRSYDAIVSDYQMPELDGIEFLKAIRERVGTIPFILFTGRGREEVVIDAINNGADFYLQKGGEPTAQFAELATKIRYAVLRKRAEQEVQKKIEELNASYEQIAAAEEELRQQLDELTEKQAALKESEERFRAFTENIPDLTTIADATGMYKYVSPSIQRITGWRAEDLLGKKIGEIDAIFGLVPDEIAALRMIGQTAMQQPGVPVPVAPFRVRDVQGTSLYVEGSMIFMPDVKGIQGIVFHGRDVTDRVRAEEDLRRKNEELNASYEQITAADEELRGQYDELVISEKRIRENEAKFRSLFEKTHDALILFSDKGCIDCNNRAVALFGYASREELLGLTPADVSPPLQPDGQDSKTAAAARIRVVLENDADHFEWLQQRKDGSMFSADVLLSVFELNGQQVFLSSVRDITERKRMEEELRLLKFSVDHAYDEVFWLDFSGKILYVNEAACRVTGYSREELQAMKIFELDPDFPPEVWDAAVSDLREKKAHLFTTRHRCRDGRIIDVEISSAYITRGGTEYSIAFARDITGRKRIENALREKTEELDQFFSASIDLLCIADTSGRFRRLNPEWEQTLGYPIAELEGRSFLDLVHPDDLEATRTAVADLAAQNRVVSFTNRFRHRDGTYRWIEWRSFPKGNLIYAAARDITERRRAEQEIRHSRDMFRSIIDNIQDAYIRTDNEGRITMVSPSAAHLYGYDSGEEMIGLPAAVLYAYPDGRDRALRKMHESDGRIHDFSGIGKRKDGTTFWASLNVQIITDDQGRVAGTEGMVRDITERRMMEHAIEEANKKLNLLSSITRHDVVNQLTMLQGYTQLAAMKNPDPVVADFLSKIERAAETITRQIGFTKAYQELGVRSPAWSRLDMLIAGLGAAEVRPAGSCRAIEIFADPMIERVFYNLVDNARRHGEHVTEIAVRCEQVPDGLLIVVEDNGVGIAPEEKEKIFGKGYGKNSGFGLFLAREILAITGITIRETGYLGVGARFEITVPPDAFRIAAGG